MYYSYLSFFYFSGGIYPCIAFKKYSGTSELRFSALCRGRLSYRASKEVKGRVKAAKSSDGCQIRSFVKTPWTPATLSYFVVLLSEIGTVLSHIKEGSEVYKSEQFNPCQCLQ
jgi:hypothetical protein